MPVLIDRLVIVTVILASAYLPSAISQQLDPITDPEAYAVYAAVLPRMWTSVSKQPLLLQQETDTYMECSSRSRSPDREIGWAAVEISYKAVNARARLLRPMLPVNIPYRLIPRAEIAADDARLALKYPGQWQRRPESMEYAGVSAVGFNASKTKAVISI